MVYVVNYLLLSKSEARTGINSRPEDTAQPLDSTKGKSSITKETAEADQSKDAGPNNETAERTIPVEGYSYPASEVSAPPPASATLETDDQVSQVIYGSGTSITAALSVCISMTSKGDIRIANNFSGGQPGAARQ